MCNVLSLQKGRPMSYLIMSLLGLLLLQPFAWAEYRKTPTTRFDLSELTSEFKQAVPDLEGCDDTHGTLTCRRLTGEFTEAEKAALDTVLTAHDPDVKAKRHTQQNQHRRDAKMKLKALGLTEEEVNALVGIR